MIFKHFYFFLRKLNINAILLGITPLHDACTNGHLEVIQYLLNRGAPIIAKTDDTGQTPLDFLKQWHQNADTLPHDRQQLYNSILQQMQTTLERFGQKIDKPPVLSTCSAYQDEEGGVVVGVRRRSVVSGSPSPRKRAQKSPKKSMGRIGEARRRICDDDDDDDEKEKEEEEKRDSMAKEGW